MSSSGDDLSDRHKQSQLLGTCLWPALTDQVDEHIQAAFNQPISQSINQFVDFSNALSAARQTNGSVHLCLINLRRVFTSDRFTTASHPVSVHGSSTNKPRQTTTNGSFINFSSIARLGVCMWVCAGVRPWPLTLATFRRGANHRKALAKISVISSYIV